MKDGPNRIVEAAAGTGKTESLVYTILQCVFGDGTSLPRILALTFTEKAANEMRKRVADALSELARGSPKVQDILKRRTGLTVDPARAREALRDVESAMITTIHSFCAHVLRLFPVEASVAPDFEVDEGDRFEALFDRRWTEWLDRELQDETPSKGEWMDVLQAADLQSVRDLASELSRRFVAPFVSALPERTESKRQLERGQKLLQKLAGEKNPNVRNLKMAVQLLKDHADGSLAGADVWRSKLIKAIDSEKMPKKYAEIGPEIARIVECGRSLPGQIAACKAAALVAPFAEKFRDEFVRLGYMSFDGLVSFTRRLLAENSFVRHRLKEMFDAILVDEFQDTDPLQYDIILYLAEKPANFAAQAREAELAPGKLYIVGDPKQSIYAFRGADIEAYELTQKRVLSQGGEKKPLDVNYRSRSNILHVVNAVFSRLIRPKAGLQPDYVELRPSRQEGGEVTVARMQAGSAEEAREAEARHIGDWIDANVAVGERGTVAILLRSLNDVQVYLDALRRRGIPYVIEGEKFYYQAQEIVDFVNLLAAAVNPHDKIALAGFLRSFAAGLDDRALFAMREKLNYLQDATEASRVYAKLRELHEASTKLRVDALVDLALEKFPIIEAASATYYGPQAVSNLLKLRLQASEAARSGKTSAVAFVERARKNIESFKEEGESPIADERLDAVKVLTIHKSKGLEFETVFVADLHRRLMDSVDDRVLTDWGTGRVGVSLDRHMVDSAGLEIKRKIEARQREEAKRLLYVAMTRAKSKLFLTGKFEKAEGFADMLLEGMTGLSGAPAGPLKCGGEVTVVDVQVPRAPDVARPVEAAAVKVDVDTYAREWKLRRQAWAQSLDTKRFVTPSSLGPEVEPTVEEPPVMDHQRAVGTVCHELLAGRPAEQIDAPEDVVEEAQRILKRYAKSKAYEREAAGRVLGREVPFAARMGEQIVSGRIDLILEEQGVVWVVDYKSGREESDYSQQMRMYRDAAAKALGRAVQAAVIHLPTGKWLDIPI